ncbi:MAG: DLW-39 family protein, partial [Gaiellales bacterium]
MKKLLALLAAIGAVVFFWRKKHADDDACDTASDTASSWG